MDTHRLRLLEQEQEEQQEDTHPSVDHQDMAMVSNTNFTIINNKPTLQCHNRICSNNSSTFRPKAQAGFYLLRRLVVGPSTLRHVNRLSHHRLRHHTRVRRIIQTTWLPLPHLHFRTQSEHLEVVHFDPMVADLQEIPRRTILL